MGGTRIVERYSYTSGGLVTEKRLHPMNVNTPWPNEAGGLIGSPGAYMEAVYTYNNVGQMVSVKYPGDTQTSGPWRTYTYAFDTMGRPNRLTDNQATPLDWVKDVLYSPGGQMTQIKFTENPNIYYTETRSYNARQQLTQISTTGTTTFNTQYVYSATQNNGQISQSIDAVSGETVDYTYDSLNRLITAATTGPQWGLSFGYDGFGNRLTQTVTKGSAPASSLAISLANNRITTSGYSYDSNGNLTAMPYGAGSMTLTYDVENRLIQAVNSNGTEQYGYSPDNRRVYQKLPSGSGGSQWIHFYGANGDRLRTYTYYGNGQFQVSKTNLYFAGRLIVAGNTVAFIDRLGSDRKGARYYPYGQEITSTGNDRDKFATYSRDSSTGLDYAMNRYYGSNLGRFITPDPFDGSARLGNPSTWNRYSYVSNDPVNKNDPSGLFEPGDFGPSPLDLMLWGYWLTPTIAWGMPVLPEPEPPPAKDYSKEMIPDKSNAPDALKYAVEHLADTCKKAFDKAFSDLGGYGKLKSGAKDVRFWDARVGYDGGKLASDIVPGAPNQTLAEMMRFNNGEVLTGAGGISNHVALGRFFFDSTFGARLQQTTLLDESLHAVYKLTNDQIAGRLELSTENTSSSIAIQKFLRDDCKK